LAGIHGLFSGILSWPVELNYYKVSLPKLVYNTLLHKP
jgi:hypothetical protein